MISRPFANRLTALAMLASAACASSASAADLFVDAGVGADVNDGLSWARAKASIGAALAAAALTPEADVVSVGEGTYGERLVMPPDVQLLGSFPSGGGASDLRLHPSIIDGQRLGRCVEFGLGTDACVLDGFVVRNGLLPRAEGAAGILITNAAPTVRRCLLEDNEAGSGAAIGVVLYNATIPGAPRIEQCIVRRSRVLVDNGSAVSIGMPSQGWPPEFRMTDVVIEDTVQVQRADWHALGLNIGPFRAPVRLERVIVRRSEGDGAVVATTSVGIELINCEFSDNDRTQLTLPTNTGDGVAVPARIVLRNCTVFGGTDGVKGRSCCALGAMPDYEIRRCIFGPSRSGLYVSRFEQSLDLYDFPTPENVTDNIIVGDTDGTFGNFAAGATFASGRWGDYCLAQVASGQVTDSFGVDQSVTLATDAGMDALTTRSDAQPDIGQADYGVHYWPLGLWGATPSVIDIHRSGDPTALPLWASTPDLPWLDAPGELSDSSEPLVFYSVEGAENDIRVGKDVATDTVRLTF